MKDVTIKIVTQYDGSGAAAAKADMAAMGKQSGGSSAGSAAKAAAEEAKAAAAAIEEAAKKAAEEAAEAAKLAQESQEPLNKEIWLTKEQYDAARNASFKFKKAAPEPYESIKKSAPAATASVLAFRAGMSKARVAADALGQSINKAMGYLGIIMMAWQGAKMLWEWWNKADTEKQARRDEARKRKLEEQKKAAEAAAVAMKALREKEAETRYLECRAVLAKNYEQTLDEQLKKQQAQNEEEQKALKLAALKLNNEREAEELRLQADFAAGEIDESKFKLKMQELKHAREEDAPMQERKETTQAAQAAWEQYDSLRRGAAKYRHGANEREMGEDTYQSIEAYDAASKQYDATKKASERRKIYAKMKRSRQHFQRLGYDTQDQGMVALAYRDNEETMAMLRSKGDATQGKADTSKGAYEARLADLLALDAIDEERRRHQRTERAALIEAEDLRIAQEQEANKQLLLQQQLTKSKDAEAAAGKAAAEALKDFEQSSAGDYEVRKNAAGLLNAAKGDEAMMQKIFAASSGRRVGLSAAQRDRYGEQWDQMRGSSRSLRDEVSGVARAHLVAGSAGERAERLQGRSQQAASRQQEDELSQKQGKTSESAAAIAAAKKAATQELNAENKELLSLITRLTSQLEQAAAAGAAQSDRYADMESRLAATQRQLDQNKQQLQNLKRR